MTLELVKRTVARVDIDGKPNGTAFLVGSALVATAYHVLDGLESVQLTFLDWPVDDRVRTATRAWHPPSGHDVAILKLDRPAPKTVKPLKWRREPVEVGAKWLTWGYPDGVPSGHTLDGVVDDPTQTIHELELEVMQLGSDAATYDLRGVSGAPCVVDERVIGILTYQLRRVVEGSVRAVPSLATLYALPIAIVTPGGVPTLFEKTPWQVRIPAPLRGLLRRPLLYCWALAVFALWLSFLKVAALPWQSMAIASVACLLPSYGLDRVWFALKALRERKDVSSREK